MLNLPNGVCSWLMVTIKVGAVRKKLNKACVLDQKCMKQVMFSEEFQPLPKPYSFKLKNNLDH